MTIQSIQSLLLSRDEAREIDHRAINEFGIPSIVLMENAGRNICEYILRLENVNTITICCGKGNNGGDGFVVARHLDNHARSVQVLLFADPKELSKDSATNYKICLQSGIPITMINAKNLENIHSQFLEHSQLIIDALFGTGLQGVVHPPFSHIIQSINALGKPILSIDIPSGLDCDTGEVLGTAIKATYTLTFIGAKKGFVKEKAKAYLGHLHIVDIGIPRVLMNEYQVKD